MSDGRNSKVPVFHLLPETRVLWFDREAQIYKGMIMESGTSKNFGGALFVATDHPEGAYLMENSGPSSN